MKVQVSEATRLQLNYLVGVAEGFQWQTDDPKVGLHCGKLVLVALDYALMDDWGLTPYAPAESWSVAGPIIEREGISTVRDEGDDYWQAVTDANSGSMFGPGLCGNNFQCGPTPLIAAMRCYVASRLGDEVDVPDELV